MISDSFPTRTDVPWKIDADGRVVIVSEKRLGRIERVIAKFIRAPMSINRPLDDMNSTLWQLMDGNNSLTGIILEMDRKFAEKIAPAAERVTVSIGNFVELGYARILGNKNEINWDTGPFESE